MKNWCLLMCLLGLMSCATQTFTVRSGGGTQTMDNAQTFFISGIGQEQIVDAAKICGGEENVVKVQNKLTFLNALIGGLTFGIYTPRQSRVYCRN